MIQFKTLQFPNTPSGQAQKIRVLQQEAAQGWQVVSETIVAGKFRGGKACCLFLIFAPCAFLAGHTNDIITVTLKRDTNQNSTSLGQVQGGESQGFDSAKWNALIKYDADIASAVDSLRQLDRKWTAELASAYLTLNDKAYLPDIVARIKERAHLEEEEKSAALLRAEERKKAEIERLELERQARKEYYLLWYRRLWGTNQRRLWTTAICVIFGLAVFLLSRSLFDGATHDDSAVGAPSSQSTVHPPLVVSTPSFDCTKVRSRVLRLICATPELAAYDQQLAAAYKSALSISSSPKQLRASERAWIRQRNNLEPDVTILKQVYEERIDFLERMTNLPEPANSE